MINLKELRKNKGLTQRELAEKAGNVVTRNQIHNIESGKTGISPKTAKALGQVLNIEWTAFFETETSVAIPKRFTETR